VAPIILQAPQRKRFRGIAR